MGFLWSILVGFVIGVIAKFVHPGRDNMGFIVTTLVGVGGSVVANFIGQLVGWYQPGENAGLIASVIGAVILLVIYGKLRSRPA